MPKQEASKSVEISFRGRIARVPVFRIDGFDIICRGHWIKTASVYDEYWQSEGVEDPESLAKELKGAPMKPDIFTFAQRLGTSFTKTFDCFSAWENVAAIRITTYKDWEKQLPQETRKNIRRAQKRNVVVDIAVFNDSLIHGIKGIYDETPVRQGRPFWHYGKSFERIKHENGSYLDRATFIGAYCEGELIGFVKMVRVGSINNIMQILAQNRHSDKRTMNALISKAVEISELQRVDYLVYGQYTYTKDGDSALREFKRRNGFAEVKFPRFYVPLSTKGAMILRLRLHLGWRQLIPPWLTKVVKRLRTEVYAGGLGILRKNASNSKGIVSTNP